MQNKSGRDKHHYHGLTEKDVLSGLKSVTEPHLVIQASKNRYLIISLFISSFGLPLMIVFELNSSLISDKNTLVNKVVTMYPKDNIEKLILKTPKNMLLYKK